MVPWEQPISGTTFCHNARCDMSKEESQYSKLGVDANKTAVRKIFSGAIDNDFPGAWVNIVRMPPFPGWVETLHMDGDGSKSVQRLLMYLESHDASYFQGMVDDAVAMNTGDIAAAGFVGDQTSGDVINVNVFNLVKDTVLEQIRERMTELRSLYRHYGINVRLLGGETGDLPHQVQTEVFDVAVHAYTQEANIIVGSVQDGDTIWGFVSDGQAIWEDEPNSGIMSNGLTQGRVKLMDRNYPMHHPNHVLRGVTYEGRFITTDQPKILGVMSVGEALCSPTRQWAILIKILIDKLKADNALHLLHGISMNTGGGATKITHLGRGGIVYNKKMPTPPPIFRLIQEECGETWRKMNTTFNCGIGLDVVGHPLLDVYLQQVQEETEVSVIRLGECSTNNDPHTNKVVLETDYGPFIY
jgi:phosphoribosylformylglycinamidine cyclo-ligase